MQNAVLCWCSCWHSWHWDASSKSQRPSFCCFSVHFFFYYTTRPPQSSLVWSVPDVEQEAHSERRPRQSSVKRGLGKEGISLPQCGRCHFKKSSVPLLLVAFTIFAFMSKSWILKQSPNGLVCTWTKKLKYRTEFMQVHADAICSQTFRKTLASEKRISASAINLTSEVCL